MHANVLRPSALTLLPPDHDTKQSLLDRIRELHIEDYNKRLKTLDILDNIKAFIKKDVICRVTPPTLNFFAEPPEAKEVN